jgi:hypothetical protein
MPGVNFNFDNPDFNGIFLVNPKGFFKQIPCPFWAHSRITTDVLIKNRAAVVEKVISDKYNRLVYFINAKGYDYDLFDLRDISF